MKAHKFYFAWPFFIFLAIMSACEKTTPPDHITTVIEGTVIDATTGEPLDSVGIQFHIEKGRDKSTGNTYFDYQSVLTDANGHFSSTAVSNGQAPIGIFLVQKDGYITKGGSYYIIDTGEETTANVTLPLIPKDGTLRLNVLNPTLINDTIYYYISSPAQSREAPISSGKIYENSIDMSWRTNYHYDFGVASEETLTIHWKFENKPNYLFSDTISVAKHTIAPFTITL